MKALNLVFAVVTVVVFGCLLLFDTTALLRLAGMCLGGECGVPSSWIAAAAAGLVALLVGRMIWRRRQGGPVSRTGAARTAKGTRAASRPAAAASRKAAKPKPRAARPRRSP